MMATIDGITVCGTPDEINEYRRLAMDKRSSQFTTVATDTGAKFDMDSITGTIKANNGNGKERAVVMPCSTITE